MFPFFLLPFSKNIYQTFVNVKRNFFGDGGVIGSHSCRSKSSTAIVEPGIWNHIVAIVVGPLDLDIYINGANVGGVYIGEGDTLAYNVNNSGNIGRHDTYASGPEDYYNGSIDDLRFYNRALNFREIQALFNED